MIVVASQRSGASALADHLMNDKDNDHVHLAEVRGFVADDLHSALTETYAISKGTQCEQYLFSVSLNPPSDHDVSEQAFFDAAEMIEAKLALIDQPRAIVFHEKEGRRHAHIVWSRIDADEMKAINLPHFKTKLRDVSKELFLNHGWELPDGLATYGNKNPLNFTLAEWQQAKRQGIDPREIKQVFQEAWERSDGLNALKNALEDRGYFLAKGDRRGFVAMDVEGNVYSLPKWTSMKAKDVKAKLGSPDHLPSVEDVRTFLRHKVSGQMRSYIQQVKARHEDQLAPIYAERNEMFKTHRCERQNLKRGQAKRWAEEAKERQGRFNKGLRGALDWIIGKRKAIEDNNIQETMDCAKRDQTQRDDLIAVQMKERRALQRRFSNIRTKQREDRKILAREIAALLRRLDQNSSRTSERTRVHRRNGSVDLTR
ncbi:MAG: relaxase/mobilization nuclease domain-containing protein [Pseudomonadota bacterium]